MNKLKTGISLIILGNILYLAYIFFTVNIFNINPENEMKQAILEILVEGFYLVYLLELIL